MTSTELERLIRGKLEASGLLQAIDEHKSQFMEFPSELFAELVLTDGSKLVDVERIGRELRESLKKQGVEVVVIVRSIWIVKTLDGPKSAITVAGGIRPAWAFTATLLSGGLSCNVEVDVTMSAVDAIKRSVAEKSAGLVDEGSAIKEIVKEFLKLRLSFGGESYWDPLRERQLDLNEDALSYWLGPALAGRR
jgi:hypothetical protein